MEVLKAQLKNNNFYVFENMLYSKTGIEIIYLGPERTNDDEYSFYENGCRYIYQTKDLKMICYYINNGKRLLTYKETRPEFFDKTSVLPLKNGVLLTFFDDQKVETYAYKSIYGKKFVSTNIKEVFNFIDGYNDACEQVF